MPNTRLAYFAACKADILEWTAARLRSLGTPADWMVRAERNRALPEIKKL
ncbi:hypothetical protein [Thiocystis violacea]